MCFLKEQVLKEDSQELIEKVRARAKVNLYLEVLYQRKDRFHDIFSVFTLIDWPDELEFYSFKKNKFSFISLDPVLQKNNIIEKAAKLLKPYKKNKKGVQIKLHKKVPYQAGLGSASCNAAATLNWLNQFWECGLDFNKLHFLALKLGADVPFFLQEKPCCITGKGEIIKPLNRQKPLALIIMKPKNVSISTPWAYQKIANEKAYTNHKEQQENFLQAFELGNDEEMVQLLFNSFENILQKDFPFIHQCKTILLNAGALGSVLSGSGSALVGVFKDEESLKKGLSYFYQKNLKEIFDFKTSFL